MQPDLIGLEFSKGELRRLTGVDPDTVFRPTISQNKEKRTSFILNEILICFVVSTIIVGFIYTFIIIANITSASQLTIIVLIIVPLTVAIGRWLWRQKTVPKALATILNEVDKYHAVINKIDANALAINEVDISRDRNLLIAALQNIRKNLSHALRIERSLRTDKKYLINPGSSNIPELRLRQSPQTSEYRRILDEALQIEINVQISIQEEMRKLQRQYSK